MFSQTLYGDWDKASKRFERMKVTFAKAVEEAVVDEAAFFQDKLVEGVLAGAPGGIPWAPLSPLTLALRRAQHGADAGALAALAGTFKVVKLGGGSHVRAFVGIAPGAKIGGRPAQEMVTLHARGAQIVRTENMRRYLWAVLGDAGEKGEYGRWSHTKSDSDGVLRIPPRPIFGPTAAQWARPADVKGRIADSVAKAMDGDLKRIR